MSVRDEILKKREKMSINELNAAAPEETTRMKFHRVTSKIKRGAKFLGIINDAPSSTIKIPLNNNTNERECDNNSTETAFKESIRFDPSEAYRRRMNEKGYLETIGMKEKDLVLTEEEYLKRKKEDDYFDSLPGYRKKDSERDGER